MVKILAFFLSLAAILSLSFSAFSQTKNPIYTEIENDLKQLETEMGHSLSSDQILMLGAMLIAESKTREESQKGLEFIKKSAQMGNSEAQYGLGAAYREGEGIERDAEKAFVWTKKSAENGFLDAEFNIAHMYHNGIGTTVDEKAAIEWYTVAADKGHVDAQYNLGNIYGQKKKNSLARKYLRMAALNGQAEAQRNLALQYATLPNSGDNTKRAIMWIFVADYNGLDVDDVTAAIGSLLNPSDAELHNAIDAGLVCIDSDYKSCL